MFLWGTYIMWKEVLGSVDGEARGLGEGEGGFGFGAVCVCVINGLK